MKAIPITAASCTGKFEEENTTGKGEVLEYEMEELPVALQEASKNTSWQVPNFHYVSLQTLLDRSCNPPCMLRGNLYNY